MTIEIVSTSRAPAPGGHYSQAVTYAGLIYVSGQLPPRTAGEALADFKTQAREALGCLLSIVEEAGSSPDQVLKVTAYIVGVENWSIFNEEFAQAFGSSRPARAVVPVPELHYGCLVEVDAIAAKLE